MTMQAYQPMTRDELTQTLKRLIHQTNADTYDPMKEIAWTDAVSEERPWMSPELMSIHGTPYWDSLDEEQRLRLSKWECVNFFSLNVTGIRELLVEMLSRIHTPGFEALSEYMHHIVQEENEHMWYFSRFCNTYAGKIYKDRTFRNPPPPEADVQQFIAFTTILIFEEIVDYYNSRMGKDDSLPPLVRQLNELHHLDETRHISFGRLSAQMWHAELRAKYGEERMADLEKTLKRFMVMSTQKLYNPEIYKDARLPDAARMRGQLLAHPARIAFQGELLSKTVKFFVKSGIFKDAALS